MNKISLEKKSIQKLLVFLSLFFLSLIVFCALFAEFLMPYNLSDGSLSKSLCGISKEHPFGCDLYGVDLLSEIILGSRTSVLISLSVVSLTTLTGCLFGSLAAFFRGWWDTLFLQITESFMALPGILIIIAFGSVVDMSFFTIILALSLTGWMGPARLVRAKLLECREYDYVLASKAIGTGPFRLIVKHLLPNLYSPLLVTAIFGVAGVILTEATLSFLGLGPQNTVSWGFLIQQGKSVLLEAPHLSLLPGACIFFLILSLNTLGDEMGRRAKKPGDPEDF